MKHLRTGVLITLPLLIFIWLFNKLKELLFGFSENLLYIFDKESSDNNILKIFIILVIIVVIYILGYLYNHYYIGSKIRKLGHLLVYRIPVLGMFYRIAKQVEETFRKKNSFKEVVLVEFPAPGIYSIGFITGKNTEVFEKLINDDVVSVFMPTTPNPTNGFLSLVRKDKIIRTDISVTNAIEYIISMGTVNINLDNDLVS